MGNTELFFVTAGSQHGEGVNSTPIITGSQEEDMVAIDKEDLARHELGVFVSVSLGKGVPAIGYVACKEIITIAALSATPDLGLPEDRLQTFALIGGLYITEGFRGRGLASQLVA